MKAWPTMFVVLSMLIGAVLAQPGATEKGVRFQAVDVFIDTRDRPLAAYELEFSVKNGSAKVVGIEGGEHPAFKDAPFYDPKAIQQEHVIIAAFNTLAADKLPKGKTRVATIHLQLAGESEPEFRLELQTAATANGHKVSAKATFEERKTK